MFRRLLTTPPAHSRVLLVRGIGGASGQSSSVARYVVCKLLRAAYGDVQAHMCVIGFGEESRATLQLAAQAVTAQSSEEETIRL